MGYAGEGELKLKQKKPRWMNTERAHCICGARYVYAGSALSAKGLLWTDMHQPQSKAHNWAIQNQANTEPQMPIWALKYVSTAVVVFQLPPLPIHIGYKCSFRSLLITVCGSPFPSFVTLVQTLCINLHSISDLLNCIRCALDSISFERQRLILQADLASQSLTTAMMC